MDAVRGDVLAPREQSLKSGVAGVKAAPEMLYAFILDFGEINHLRRVGYFTASLCVCTEMLSPFG